MPTTGEKPGKGSYQCTRCGQIVVLTMILILFPVPWMQQHGIYRSVECRGVF